MNKFSRCAIVACTLLAGLTAGCSSTPPSRLYLLEPMVTQHSKSSSELTIAIARVILPEYLKRDEILTREQRFRVNAASFDRWAEPLDYNIGDVLAENLSLLIRSDRVVAYPWDTTLKADYTVRLRVITFNTSSTGEIELTRTIHELPR